MQIKSLQSSSFGRKSLLACKPTSQTSNSAKNNIKIAGKITTDITQASENLTKALNTKNRDLIRLAAAQLTNALLIAKKGMRELEKVLTTMM